MYLNTSSIYFCSIFIIVLTYTQKEYIVISERFEITANEKYINNVKYSNYKHNRTWAVLNVSGNLLVDFGTAMTATLQAYKFSSNEYRLFPITFDANVCEFITENRFGIQNLYTNGCGNLPKCPFVKGAYDVCKWQPDFRKFPPHVPTGSYRLDINFYYDKQKVAYVQWFDDKAQNAGRANWVHCIKPP